MAKVIGRKTVLIFGATGFIGSALLKYLADAGFNLRLLGRDFSGRQDCLVHDCRHIDFDGNIGGLSPELFESVEVVIHAAGLSAEQCKISPESALWFNGSLTHELAISAQQAGVKRFLFLSTCHVYSGRLSLNYREESPLNGCHNRSIL